MLDDEFGFKVVDFQIAPDDDKTGNDAKRGNAAAKGRFLMVDVRLQRRRAVSMRFAKIDNFDSHHFGDRNLGVEMKVDVSGRQHGRLAYGGRKGCEIVTNESV